MTVSMVRPAQTTETRLRPGTRKEFAGPEHHDFVIHRMTSFGNSERELPSRVVLLRPDPGRPGTDQLFIDQVPVPREAWSYDAHDRVLSWQGAFGGGHLRLTRDGLGAAGTIGPALDHASVWAGARAQFSCDVALDCGAVYETSGDKAIGLVWEPASEQWKGADWTANRLLLTYTVIQGGPMSPPSFTFEFQDNQTGAIPWDPGPGSFGATLRFGQRDGLGVWFLGFKSAVPPDPDRGPNPATGADSVYPLWMQAVEDAAAATITGVLEIGKPAPDGTLVGLRGVRAQAAVTGYYQTTPDSAPFGVFDARMVIGDGAVPGSAVVGDELRWSDLDPEHQRRTGLPAQGAVRFTQDGSRAAGESVRIRRLTTTAALAAIAAHSDLHQEAHRGAGLLATALEGPGLKIDGLIAMTPYGQDRKGVWSDVVQAGVTDDLYTIMNSFISADLWNLLFPSTPQPTLSGDLAEIANSPVDGVPDPQAWYRSLATAVLTQGMAGGADDNCQYLNGPRAAAWLKTEVAASTVYAAHGAQLFAKHWQAHCPLTADYLADQDDQAATYAPQVTAAVQASVADINANVVTDADSPPGLKESLIADVTNAGQYALDNKLYWAFAFYTYNTAPGCLANIAQAMSVTTGSTDGTGLSRLFQQNVAVLSALDPSGYFVKRYTATLNTFLATNILPSMFGFDGDAASFDIIKEYLQAFVDKNLTNADKDIAAAAAKIQSILDDKDADQKLHDCIEALREISSTISDALALPYIANEFVSWFSTKFPNLTPVASIFGSVFIGAVTGLAVFNLFTEFKGFDKLTPAERTSLITNTLQLGLQIIAAVVKRGVRIYAIFEVTGMTTAQRVAAVSQLLVSGETKDLDVGLLRIGNSMARWLGDTEGTIGQVATGEYGALTAVLVTDTTAAAEEATWASKVFGRNLDEFIATRVGPLFILAGIGLSIYFITTGESGVQLAGDILNIIGGSLMIFATIGQWAVDSALVAEGTLLADFIAFAGPLAILAALAGLALMLYEIFKKPPDPVATFVSDYAKPAGFSVAGRACAIDYARPYIDKTHGNLLMIGFTLAAGGRTLTAAPSGSIGLGAGSSLPDCVWQATTDGSGMTRVFTVTQPDATKPLVLAYLSLMSDGTVSFQPATAAKTPQAGPTVLTRTWMATPAGAAATTADGELVGFDLALVAMREPTDGTWPPKESIGALTAAGDSVAITATGTTFHLTMSGMAPNHMSMGDLNFVLGSKPMQQRYGPRYAVLPSTPMTYALTGDALPAFVTFSADTGTLATSGQKADAAAHAAETLSAKNSLGSASATFTVTVAPPKTAP